MATTPFDGTKTPPTNERAIQGTKAYRATNTPYDERSRAELSLASGTRRAPSKDRNVPTRTNSGAVSGRKHSGGARLKGGKF